MGDFEDISKTDQNDLAEYNERQMLLEEIAAHALLVELFNAKKAEVFENVVFEGKRRYYVENLNERDYSLECTTPYQLEILGNAIEEHTWGLLLCKVAELLLILFPDSKEKLLTFQSPWTKAKMFTSVKKTNYKSIKGELFINCNHTALHACWFLQDLLDFFGVDKSSVSFLIHRPCSAEPKNVKDYISNRFQRNFTEFMCAKYKKTEEYVAKVIKTIEKHLNPMLSSISKSYTNLFLFDDNATFSNYVKKIREMIHNNLKFDIKAKEVLNKYLDYLCLYYKSN